VVVVVVLVVVVLVAVVVVATDWILRPLFQTSLFPFRTHVYLNPAKIVVLPLGEQVVPGFMAADETFEKTTKEVATRISAMIRFIVED